MKSSAHTLSSTESPRSPWESVSQLFQPRIEWERPLPSRYLLKDTVGWFIACLLCLTHIMALQGMGVEFLQEVDAFSLYGATAAMTLPLVIRRRFPLTSMVGGTILFFVLGTLVFEASIQIGFQCCYFALIYAGVAWAKDRRWMKILSTVILLLVLTWIISGWIITGSAYYVAVDLDSDTAGPLSPSMASLVSGILINSIFYGGAFAFGQTSYMRAYQHSVVQKQAQQLEENAVQMAQDAVTKDRLRIARELHDSIGHYVSAISVQAAAARRVLSKKPEAAALPLANIEKSARQAVGEMRSVLGVLRAESAPLDGQEGRDEPQLTDIAELGRRLSASGLTVTSSLVEHLPGALEKLSRGTQLSLYRIAQEALNNTLKHSGARKAHVSLRTGESTQGGWAEIEITDNGQSTSAGESSGYGLRGIQERAKALGGSYEAGQRIGADGWRVRVRIPHRF